MDPVARAGMEVDKPDVSDVSVESVPLSLFVIKDIKLAGVPVPDGLGSVTTVPFENETFRVEV